MVPLIIAERAGAKSRFSIGVVIAAGMTMGTLFARFVTPVVYTFTARDHDLTRAVAGLRIRVNATSVTLSSPRLRGEGGAKRRMWGVPAIEPLSRPFGPFSPQGAKGKRSRRRHQPEFGALTGVGQAIVAALTAC